jgi:hypothetical protein
MSETSKKDGSTRPRQLTMAGWFVVGASVLLVLTAFDSLSSLSSVERRESLGETLSQPPLDGLGVTITEALAVMRVGLMVAAACAAAAAVLGVFVLQRHRGARVALSVVAVPLLLSTFVTGDLLGALVAGATLVLWTGPARDWYAGRPVREPARRGEAARDDRSPSVFSAPPDRRPEAGPDAADRRGGPEAPHVSTAKTSLPQGGPPASSGFGAPAALAERPGPTWSAPPGGQAYPPVHGSDPGPVPVPVKIACLLTWVFSAVVALMYAVILAVLAADSDRLVDYVVASPEWKRANLNPDLLLPVLWVGCLMFLGWALGACLLAWFTWRRHGWARWLLAASAGAAAVAGLFAFPVGLLHQVAAILTIVGLFSAAARSWFAPDLTGGRHYPPGPPNGPGGYPGGPTDQQGPPAWSSAPPPGSDPGRPPQDDKPPVW